MLCKFIEAIYNALGVVRKLWAQPPWLMRLESKALDKLAEIKDKEPSEEVKEPIPDEFSGDTILPGEDKK